MEFLKMEIGGLQKVSTIDYPREICCVIFLRGCNFRCGFCHNPQLVVDYEESGVRSQESEGEVLDFLKRRVGRLDAVCISGGEPLMNLNFDFVKKIRELGFKIKIDTNGSFPDRLKEMIDLGLVDYVAMDVKGCRRDYEKICGVGVDLSVVEKSMKIIYDFGRLASGDGNLADGGNLAEQKIARGLTRINADGNLREEKNKLQTSMDEHGQKNSYEFRTTVVGRYHNVENLVEMAKWVGEVCGGKPKRFFLQGFRNSGDLVGEDFVNEKNVGLDFLLKVKDKLKDYFEEVGVRG